MHLRNPVKMFVCWRWVHTYIHNETQCSHKPNSRIC